MTVQVMNVISPLVTKCLSAAFRQLDQWVAAVVTRSRGPVSYDVELADGRIAHRHIDHIQTRTVPAITSIPEESPLPLPLPGSISEVPVPNSTIAEYSDTNLRRSSRTRRPPDRYTELGIVPY